MKLRTIAFIAAMLPAIAQAGPNPQRNADKNAPRDQQVQVDAYEWSMGQGRLGMLVMGLTPELRSYFGAPRDSGLLVAQVESNSPAARAGIRVGDVITQLANDKVETAGDILMSMTKVEGARPISIQLVRDHKQMTVQATLGKPKSSV